MKPQARCGRIRRQRDEGPRVPLSRNSLCVWCEFAPLSTRQVSSRLDSGPLGPAEAARKPQAAVWVLGCGSRASGPPAECRRHNPCPVDQLGGGHACDPMAWALAGSDGGQQGLHSARCAAGVTATATMQRDGLTVANAQLYVWAVWAVVVLTAVLRPLACNTGPTNNDCAGAGMLRLSLISLRGE